MVSSKQNVNTEEIIKRLCGRIATNSSAEVVTVDLELRNTIIQKALTEFENREDWSILSVKCKKNESIIFLLKSIAENVYTLQNQLKEKNANQEDWVEKVHTKLNRKYERFINNQNLDGFDNGLQKYVETLKRDSGLNLILLIEDFDSVSGSYTKVDFDSLRPYTDLFVILVSSKCSIKELEEEASGSAYVFNQFETYLEDL